MELWAAAGSLALWEEDQIMTYRRLLSDVEAQAAATANNVADADVAAESGDCEVMPFDGKVAARPHRRRESSIDVRML